MAEFTSKFVLGLTVRKMRQAVTHSTDKTLARAGEFKDNPEKATEVYNALLGLQTLSKSIDEIEARLANILN